METQSESKESSHNHRQNKILWDIVFRSRYLPKNIQHPANIGISQPSHFTKSYIKQQLSPLDWKALKMKHNKFA